MKLAYIIIILICLPIFGTGQNFHVNAYTSKDGLPADQIQHVTQDTLGFLWLVTDNGLVRFDGTDFQVFSQQVPSQYGNHFCVFNDKLLFSHNAGISEISPGVDTSLIKTFLTSSIDPNAPELYYPEQLFVDSQQRLWISQANGIVTCLSQSKQKDYQMTNQTEKYTSFFAETSDKNIYIANSLGQVYFFNDEKKETKLLAEFASINSLLVKGKELWIAGDRIHQLKMSEQGDKLLRQKTYEDAPGPITAMTIDEQGYFYLGIKNKGLFLFDPLLKGTEAFVKIFSNNDPHRVDELPFKNINSIEANDQQQLLICAEEGFGILQKRFFESASGLPNGNINSIANLADGGIFVNFGDVYTINERGFGFESTALSQFKGGNISSLCNNGKRLWIGTSNGKLLDTDINGQVLNTIDLSERGEGIFYMLRDSKKGLWICQAPSEKPIVGIACRLPNGELKEYGVSKGLEDRILVIKSSEQGRLYAGGIGKNTYLYRYIPEEDNFLNLSLPFDFYIRPNFEVHDLTVDRQGLIWLATTDGLLRYDMDRIRKIELSDANEQLEVRAVQAMPDGSIWVSTDTEGVIRYDGKEVVYFREESGLPSKVMSYRSLLRDHNDRLWVGTAEGLVYSLDTVPRPKQTRPPLLVSLQVNKEVRAKNQLKMFQDERLKLEFNCPSFHGFRTFYQYKINDADWSGETIDNQLFFDQLPIGKHTILVRTKNEGSNYYSTAFQLPVEVQQHWYQKLSFRSMLFVASLLLIAWFWLYQRKSYNTLISRLTKELKLNKAIVNQKEKALEKAKAEIDEEHKEERVNRISLDILKGFIEKVSFETKWDEVLERLSIDLLRFHGVRAFEIAIKRQGQIDLEGYSEIVHGFTSAHQRYQLQTSLVAYAISQDRAMLFNDLQDISKTTLTKPDNRLDQYRSALVVPFFIKDKKAALLLYSDQVDYFDQFNLKTIGILASYLEQISKQ